MPEFRNGVSAPTLKGHKRSKAECVFMSKASGRAIGDRVACRRMRAGKAAMKGEMSSRVYGKEVAVESRMGRVSSGALQRDNESKL